MCRSLFGFEKNRYNEEYNCCGCQNKFDGCTVINNLQCPGIESSIQNHEHKKIFTDVEKASGDGNSAKCLPPICPALFIPDMVTGKNKKTGICQNKKKIQVNVHPYITWIPEK